MMSLCVAFSHLQPLFVFGGVDKGTIFVEGASKPHLTHGTKATVKQFLFLVRVVEVSPLHVSRGKHLKEPMSVPVAHLPRFEMVLWVRL